MASFESELAWNERCQRSLATSRTRRRAAEGLRRRRIRFRGGGVSLATMALMVAIAGSGVAVGHQTIARSGDGSGLLSEARGSGGSEVASVQAALGLPATGFFGPDTTRAVRAFQAKRGLLVDGIVGPQTRAALGLGGSAAAASSGPGSRPSGGSASHPGDGSGAGPSPTTGGGSGPAADAGSSAGSGGGGAPVSGALQRIAQCESGGNPRAIGGGGRYRGKYQFDRATWRALGGSGDPAAAPEAVQDRLAAKLYARSGTAPWANCA